MEENCCCEELKEFLNTLKGVSFSVGEGETSGSIELSHSNDLWSVYFNDGWSSYPSLDLKFCPYCGVKQ